ncbi:hypothetical protein MP228_004270 [Amoeboaphelidium protococcarum]|nr:hypothetical protein MP228_004270 [Amoeboaphelidium protococcarum]
MKISLISLMTMGAMGSYIKFQEALGPIVELMEQDASFPAAVAFPGGSRPKPPQMCWKSFGKAVKSQCAADEEFSAGACYPACKEGYKGFGPYCVAPKPTDSAGLDTYERVATVKDLPVSTTAVCPANMLMATDNETCIFAQCPAAVPFDCALFCSKNAYTCAVQMGGFGTALFNIIKDVSSGNWPSAINKAQALYQQVRAIPACAETAQAQSNDILVEFIQLFKN